MRIGTTSIPCACAVSTKWSAAFHVPSPFLGSMDIQPGPPVQ